ncbi:uncharacterized protein [Polyergus mexicanus]|uniref:uncharacterized protein n=1 Tax=Polyergus mexicanus TaxID=615972 RepID=UPI0038B533FF
MTDILNIEGEPVFDDRIVKIETHTYNPYANTTFEHSDEIRIPIQQQDLYTLPYESFLYIEGKLKINKPAEGFDVVLGNNCVAFMFDEIRYELDGVEIDRSRNVGITSTLKNYIQWRMPHVVLNEINKLSMLRALESGQYVSMGFRSWDLYEFPLLQRTTKHSWPIKTAIQLEKPRYVIFVLQTGRKNVMSENTSRFDDCKLINVKLYLNSECYPYDDMNLDFDKNSWSILYDTYQRFCKNATVDVRLEFECKENVPPNTTAYCLIIHDRVIQYNPLTNVVRKIT